MFKNKNENVLERSDIQKSEQRQFDEFIEKNVDFYFNSKSDDENMNSSVFDPDDFFTVDLNCDRDEEKRKLDELSYSFDSLKIDYKKSKPTDILETSVRSIMSSQISQILHTQTLNLQFQFLIQAQTLQCLVQTKNYYCH